MTQVKNMIQDFNNQFAINLCNNDVRKSTNIKIKEKINEEPYNDYYFNFLKIKNVKNVIKQEYNINVNIKII